MLDSLLPHTVPPTMIEVSQLTSPTPTNGNTISRISANVSLLLTPICNLKMQTMHCVERLTSVHTLTKCRDWGVASILIWLFDIIPPNMTFCLSMWNICMLFVTLSQAMGVAKGEAYAALSVLYVDASLISLKWSAARQHNVNPQVWSMLVFG